MRAFTSKNKATTRSKVIKTVVLVLLGLWFVQVINLIQEDTQEGEFDPYKILGVPSDSAFNSAAVKKAYRNLAIKYHPDKHADKNEKDLAEIKAKFHELVKAYVTLTEEEKYNNW
jgi:preprotein translocase subunit Sec63